MNENAEKNRAWDVLLIGGPSGVGKTSVSYRLAHRFGIGITEVDDLHIVAEQLTTPEQQPVFHYWRTNPQASELSAEAIVDLHISVCRVLSPAVEAVIANHIESHTPIVLEGDYLLPKILAPRSAERTRAVFLYEPDEMQIVKNFASREPADGEQTGRAHMSWLFGQWLKEECARLGMLALPSRPWDTALNRIAEAIV